MQQSLGLSDKEFRSLWERETKNSENISKDSSATVCSGTGKVSNASSSSTDTDFSPPSVWFQPFTDKSTYSHYLIPRPRPPIVGHHRTNQRKRMQALKNLDISSLKSQKLAKEDMDVLQTQKDNSANAKVSEEGAGIPDLNVAGPSTERRMAQDGNDGKDKAEIESDCEDYQRALETFKAQHAKILEERSTRIQFLERENSRLMEMLNIDQVAEPTGWRNKKEHRFTRNAQSLTSHSVVLSGEDRHMRSPEKDLGDTQGSTGQLFDARTYSNLLNDNVLTLKQEHLKILFPIQLTFLHRKAQNLSPI